SARTSARSFRFSSGMSNLASIEQLAVEPLCKGICHPADIVSYQLESVIHLGQTLLFCGEFLKNSTVVRRDQGRSLPGELGSLRLLVNRYRLGSLPKQIHKVSDYMPPHQLER